MPLPDLRRFLDNRTLTARRAAQVIAASTLLLTVVGGVGAWLATARISTDWGTRSGGPFRP